MNTITKELFLSDFMKISETLTSAELRILYLLITEPEVIKLTQNQFANKINVHRRTINIGLKKLLDLNFISNIYFDDADKNQNPNQSTPGEKNVSDRVSIEAERFIIGSFNSFYNPVDENTIVVNEDFYSLIMGDYSIELNFRYDKVYINHIISETYPKCRFHLNQRKSTYLSDIHYYIVRKTNSEISKARQQKRYYIDKTKLLQNISENFDLSEEEVMKIVKDNFPGLKVVKHRIQIPKPLRKK